MKPTYQEAGRPHCPTLGQAITGTKEIPFPSVFGRKVLRKLSVEAVQADRQAESVPARRQEAFLQKPA